MTHSGTRRIYRGEPKATKIEKRKIDSATATSTSLSKPKAPYRVCGFNHKRQTPPGPALAEHRARSKSSRTSPDVTSSTHMTAECPVALLHFRADDCSFCSLRRIRPSLTPLQYRGQIPRFRSVPADQRVRRPIQLLRQNPTLDGHFHVIRVSHLILHHHGDRKFWTLSTTPEL